MSKCFRTRSGIVVIHCNSFIGIHPPPYRNRVRSRYFLCGLSLNVFVLRGEPWRNRWLRPVPSPVPRPTCRNSFFPISGASLCFLICLVLDFLAPFSRLFVRFLFPRSSCCFARCSFFFFLFLPDACRAPTETVVWQISNAVSTRAPRYG